MFDNETRPLTDDELDGVVGGMGKFGGGATGGRGVFVRASSGGGDTPLGSAIAGIGGGGGRSSAPAPSGCANGECKRPA